MSSAQPLIERSEESNQLIEHLGSVNFYNTDAEQYIEYLYPYAKAFRNRNQLSLDLDDLSDALYLSWVLKKNGVTTHN
ncbi:MAG: hypothetical protein HOM11_04120 [Methylococcales bacterium]|jgi:hypothetical protein|nr:hypothetical protein [Methylococcales bacterium]MBT7445250.1 hypothetical protein [Methylococcales bacterium]